VVEWARFSFFPNGTVCPVPPAVVVSPSPPPLPRLAPSRPQKPPRLRANLIRLAPCGRYFSFPPPAPGFLGRVGRVSLPSLLRSPKFSTPATTLLSFLWPTPFFFAPPIRQLRFLARFCSAVSFLLTCWCVFLSPFPSHVSPGSPPLAQSALPHLVSVVGNGTPWTAVCLFLLLFVPFSCRPFLAIGSCVFWRSFFHEALRRRSPCLPPLRPPIFRNDTNPSLPAQAGYDYPICGCSLICLLAFSSVSSWARVGSCPPVINAHNWTLLHKLDSIG